MTKALRPRGSLDADGALTRRAFLLGVAGSAGCAGLVTTKYPHAARCTGAGCALVDAHCHVFNGADLNIEGFVTHILPVPHRLTEKLVRSLHALIDRLAPSAAEESAQLRALLAGGSLPAQVTAPREQLEALAATLAAAAAGMLSRHRSDDIAATLRMIVQSRHTIASTMLSAYDQIDLFTPALVDFAYWTRDHAKSPLIDQLEVMSLLSRCAMAGKLGARPEVRLHGFAPYNPLREVREVMSDAPYQPLGEPVSAQRPYRCSTPLPPVDASAKGALGPLRYAVEQLGYIGAKVYPPTGFLPIGNAGSAIHADPALGAKLDAALRVLYAYCQAEELPVLTHANNSNGYDLGYGLLTGPDVWANVLEEFPNLRLNLGHFGELEGDDGVRDLTACELWMRKIAVLMERYPHVYADSGASLLPVERAYQERYLALLEQLFVAYPITKKRFMYGSDFWLNGLSANSSSFVDAFSDVFARHFPDVREDFFGNNARRFLGLGDDAGGKPAQNKNRLRLQRFYAATAQPAWLRDDAG